MGRQPSGLDAGGGHDKQAGIPVVDRHGRAHRGVAGDLPTVRLGDAEQLRVGDPVRNVLAHKPTTVALLILRVGARIFVPVELD